MAAADESLIYRDLMRFKPEHLTPNAWAVQAGVSRAVWADMRRHGNPSRRTLEKLLLVAGSSLAEFEALRLADDRTARPSAKAGLADVRGWAWTPAAIPPLPLIASSLAGEWGDAGVELTEIRPGELIDRLPRPPSIASDADAYAVTIVGDSMWPRFRPGRRVAVSPRAPVAIGDDVLLRLRTRPQASASGGGELVLIKELVKRSGAFLELRQFNPGVAVRVAAAEVAAVHKIVGELI
jgi:SOS-response transcriptional repressor LexA